MKYLKKLAFMFCIIIIASGLLLGCSTNGASGNAKIGEKKVLKMIYGATDSFDIFANYVAGSWWTYGVIETLFTVNPKGEIVPLLAEKYEQLDDLTWKIKLRGNVKFHNGDPFNADAVIFSINRLKDSKQNMASSQFDFIESVTKESNDVVVIKTAMPYGGLLSKLSEYNMAIVSPKSDFKSTLIGTGPFKFEKTIKDVKTVVTRFDDYWGGKPKLDAVESLKVEDEMARVYMLYNNEADFIFLGVPVTEIDKVKSKKNLKYSAIQRSQEVVLQVNTSKGALQDSRVLQALSYAINREQLVEKACNRIGGIPAYGYLPEASSWNNINAPKTKFNQTKALALLAEAGIKDDNGDGILDYKGKPFELSLMTYDVLTFKPAVEVIQAQLKQIGININLEVTTWEMTDKKMKDGNFDLNLDISVFYGFGDPNSLSNNFQTGSIIADYTRYSNNAVDALMQKGRETIDLEKRKKCYDEVQSLVLKDLPVIPLYHDVLNMAINKRVENYVMNPYIDPRITHETNIVK